MTWQPDWQYLREHVEWLAQELQHSLDQGDLEQAQACLTELETIVRVLESVRSPGIN